jgi:hypothetical protein
VLVGGMKECEGEWGERGGWGGFVGEWAVCAHKLVIGGDANKDGMILTYRYSLCKNNACFVSYL